jgi:predicted RNase H-like HicB family nuclease
MKSYTFIIERDTQTGLLVGHVPGWTGAHAQGATHEELQTNLEEVVAMLLEEGEPTLETVFVGTSQLRVA